MHACIRLKFTSFKTVAIFTSLDNQREKRVDAFRFLQVVGKLKETLQKSKYGTCYMHVQRLITC